MERIFVFGPFFSLSEFSMSPKMRREQKERQEREHEEWLKTAEPWTAKTPWRRKLALQASSWTPWSLFAVKPTECNDVNNETKPEGKFMTSPSGQFLYCEKLLPRGSKLALLQGARRGVVAFDGPILVPSLHQKQLNGWNAEPWMGITPMEIITQRPGTRLAKGHVAVAGLGLGWALYEAMRKRSVKRVTLVEISQELIDWILPRVMDTIRLRAGEGLPKLDVVVGDARDVLWQLEADVALIDIFKGYGGNEFYVHGGARHFGGKPMNIPTVWCWGSANLTERRGWGWP